MAKYRFASSGNMTIVLSPSHQEPIYNPSTKEVIGKKFVPTKKAVFTSGYFETDDEATAILIQEQQPHWGVDVFWHPTCIPAEKREDGTILDTAKRISDGFAAKAERRRKQQEAAKEGSVPRDQ